jgi:glycosyltransferase involved in cell wall biosynthesis
MVLKLNPAVIFSMGNYAIPVKRKQLLFLHWPYVVYPDSIAWQRQKGSSDYFKRKIRKWFIKKQLRFATAITVQTPLMKKQFLTYFSYPSNANVHVVESSVSEQIENESDNHLLNKIDALKAKHKDHVFLLCLSQYYTHKNIEVLEPLAEEIKKNNARFRIFINIDASQHHKADHFLKTIKAKKLDHIIIHIGHIPQNLLYKVYQRANGFILPTLLESFGIIYREAMIAGIPIFTSDLDFAHEACGDAAFYFAPLDHKSIYNTLINAYDNPVLIQNKIDCGKKKASGFLSWEEITKKYIEVIEQL